MTGRLGDWGNGTVQAKRQPISYVPPFRTPYAHAGRADVPYALEPTLELAAVHPPIIEGAQKEETCRPKNSLI